MKRIALAFLFAAMLFLTAQAHQVNVENGSARELKGVRKVFVRADKYDKATIVAELKKRLPALRIVDNSERADVLIIFSVRSASFPANWPNAMLGTEANGASTTAIEYEIAATGNVVKPISADRIRQLIEFKDSRRSMFRSDLAIRFAKIFVESYKAANRS
jgi:hypothetical protein